MSLNFKTHMFNFPSEPCAAVFAQIEVEKFVNYEFLQNFLATFTGDLPTQHEVEGPTLRGVLVPCCAQEALLYASQTFALNPHFTKDSQHEAVRNSCKVIPLGEDRNSHAVGLVRRGGRLDQGLDKPRAQPVPAHAELQALSLKPCLKGSSALDLQMQSNALFWSGKATRRCMS